MHRNESLSRDVWKFVEDRFIEPSLTEVATNAKGKK